MPSISSKSTMRVLISQSDADIWHAMLHTLKLRKQWHWSTAGVFQTETVVDTRWWTAGTNLALNCWPAPKHPNQQTLLCHFMTHLCLHQSKDWCKHRWHGMTLNEHCQKTLQNIAVGLKHGFCVLTDILLLSDLWPILLIIYSKRQTRQFTEI